MYMAVWVCIKSICKNMLIFIGSHDHLVVRYNVNM